MPLSSPPESDLRVRYLKQISPSNAKRTWPQQPVGKPPWPREWLKSRQAVRGLDREVARQGSLVYSQPLRGPCWRVPYLQYQVMTKILRLHAKGQIAMMYHGGSSTSDLAIYTSCAA